MPTSLPQELQLAIVTERVSRIKVVNTELQKLFGMQAGGPNESPEPSRYGQYDIFSDSREVATAVAPGSASNNIAPNPVGSVSFAIPQVYENEVLTAEKLFNLRQLGSSANAIDQYGLNYIAEQEKIMKQRITNYREFQVAALLRGSYSYTAAGGKTAFTHGYSGGTYTVDYQVPSGNKNQLGGIIDASWATTSTKIVKHILQINALSASLSGRGIKHAFCNSTMWQYIVGNTEVQNLAGSSNMPYEIIRNDSSEDYTAVLKAVPWLKFHINDNGLNLSGTFTKFFADTQCSFCVEPDASVASYMTCPTPIVEYDGGSVVGATGERYWYTSLRDPAAYQLFGAMSGLPKVKIPSGIFNATTVGF